MEEANELSSNNIEPGLHSNSKLMNNRRVKMLEQIAKEKEEEEFSAINSEIIRKPISRKVEYDQLISDVLQTKSNAFITTSLDGKINSWEVNKFEIKKIMDIEAHAEIGNLC